MVKMDLEKGLVVKMEASYPVKTEAVILEETVGVLPLTMEVTFHMAAVLGEMMRFLNVLVPTLEVALILHGDFETKS